MQNKDWNDIVKNNFNKAATSYLNYSNIQRFFAVKIVSYIKELQTQKGEWLDLGAGTGLLADELEKQFSNQKVSRIDFSRNMLLQNKSTSKKILWDLNNELPSSIENCAVITSNFCIHWLNNPEFIVKNWFSKLKPGGFLIISYPSKESFTEWKETCKKTKIKYSGLNFLNSEKFSKNFKSDEIFFTKNFTYIENFPDIYKMFRSIINVGAQSTKSRTTRVGELKKIQEFWPKNFNNTVNLTWEITIQIVKKL